MRERESVGLPNQQFFNFNPQLQKSRDPAEITSTFELNHFSLWKSLLESWGLRLYWGTAIQFSCSKYSTYARWPLLLLLLELLDTHTRPGIANIPLQVSN